MIVEEEDPLVQLLEKLNLLNFIVKFIYVVFHEGSKLCDAELVLNHSFVRNFAFISL